MSCVAPNPVAANVGRLIRLAAGLCGRSDLQCGRVDAVAHPTGTGAVAKQVPQVPTASPASGLSSRQPEAEVPVKLDRPLQGVCKTRPPRP